MEVYVVGFHLFCAQITNLKLSVDNKIDCFVRGLKPKICKRVVLNPSNKGGCCEDFKGLLIYEVSMHATIEKSCSK